MLVKFLASVVQDSALSLPQIVEGERDPNSPVAIYSEDFDKLPKEVVDKFKEALEFWFLCQLCIWIIMNLWYKS